MRQSTPGEMTLVFVQNNFQFYWLPVQQQQMARYIKKYKNKAEWL